MKRALREVFEAVDALADRPRETVYGAPLDTQTVFHDAAPSAIAAEPAQARDLGGERTRLRQ